MTGRTAQNGAPIPLSGVGPSVENGCGTHRVEAQSLRDPQITGSA
jgi:hypothetical protein